MLISKLFCKRQISLYFRHTLEYRARHALNSAGEEVFHMADNFTDHTQTFNFEALQQPDMQQILTLVYDALKEKGYNPISQIVGYILSEDPQDRPRRASQGYGAHISGRIIRRAKTAARVSAGGFVLKNNVCFFPVDMVYLKIV